MTGQQGAAPAVSYGLFLVDDDESGLSHLGPLQGQGLLCGAPSVGARMFGVVPGTASSCPACRTVAAGGTP